MSDFSIHISIHTSIHTSTHTYTFIDSLSYFSSDYVYMQYMYIYGYMCVCVPCVVLLFSRIHIQEAEVLSVRFPKEYDHINLAAKHPKLCTYFIQNSVHIHTYTHAYTHTFIDSLIFSQTFIYFDIVFGCYTSRGSRC